MRKVKIVGYGTYLPEGVVQFEDQTRYRCNNGERQAELGAYACEKALENAGLKIEDIDLIINANAGPAQLIPCTAALIHEIIAKGTDIPAFDVNSSCSGFITAFDIASLYIEAGMYNTVLLVAEEMASAGLNENQKESFELFSDAAAAVILKKTDEERGVVSSMIKTFSDGAHFTEIRAGGTNHPGYIYKPEDRGEYLFDMKGKQILFVTTRYLPRVFKEFFEKNNITVDDIDLIIPHQASKALPMFMNRMKIPEGKYVNRVSEFGNMVSASVPVVLCKEMEEGHIKEGDTILLCASAAGLTVNMLLFKV